MTQNDMANQLIDYLPGLSAEVEPRRACRHRIRQAGAVLELVRGEAYRGGDQRVMDDALGAAQALLEQADALAQLPPGNGPAAGD